MTFNMTATHLYGKTLDELKEICDSLQFPSFTAKQIAHWLYVNNAGTISEMTNLSAAIREKLSVTYDLGLISPVNAQTSSDGTKKYLFPTHQGKMIESAYIPDKERATLCVSSQVGCKLGCRFCMTGMQGFQGNLTANEILNQVRSLPELRKLTNLVYMGMGEPFDNLREVIKSLQILTSSWGYAWSPKRITVSTVGIIPGMREFIE